MFKIMTGVGVFLVAAAIVLGITGSRGTTDATGIVEGSTKVIQEVSTGTTKGFDTTGGIQNHVVRPAPSTTLKELNLDGSRQVYVYGVIDESTAPAVAQRVLELGKDAAPINILINSPGGSVLDGAAIISAMQAAKGPVNTVCVQICASMAAMIHSYGTKRLMIDRSLVMFHPATGGVEGEVDKIYSRLTTLKDYIGDMELNVANRSGMSYEQYKARSGVEMWLPAKAAVAQRVADEIVFVRGSSSSKLYMNQQETMKYVNRRLPFYVYAHNTDGKFYWISYEAYTMLYGQNGLTVNPFEGNGHVR